MLGNTDLVISYQVLLYIIYELPILVKITTVLPTISINIFTQRKKTVIKKCENINYSNVLMVLKWKIHENRELSDVMM